MMGLFLCTDEYRERKSRKCDDGDSDGGSGGKKERYQIEDGIIAREREGFD